MKKLLDGVERFKKEVYPKHRDLFEKLSSGQSPEALFITCPDGCILEEGIAELPTAAAA